MLKPSEARAYYDRFGEKQDTQGFYEGPALKDLVAHANFHEAEQVFEFGCGTGRFADEILKKELPLLATYIGCDLSSTMVGLAKQRLAPYTDRAQIFQYDGKVKFELPDHSVDRVVSTYVLDLLPESDIVAFMQEAYRVLETQGKLCLVSLTKGRTLISRFVSGTWNLVYCLNAPIVGGCRPIRLEPYIRQEDWEIEYQHVVIAFGVPSEVIVIETKYSPIGSLAG